MHLKSFLAAALLAVAIFSAAVADDTFQGNVIKKSFDLTAHPPNKTSSTQILYHGGPIMNQSNSVYAIYYGTFPSTTQPIINDFLVGLSGSPQYGVNHTYNDPTSPNPMPVPLNYAFVAPSSHPNTNPSGSVYWDSYSQGTQLSTNDIPKIVTHAIGAGLPANQNAVYLVITAPDVKIADFCSR